MQVWLYTIGSVVVVSLISLVGIVSLLLNKQTVNKLVMILVSLAAGTLLGDALIHLIPEAYEHISSQTSASLLVLSGILLFFILEKFVRWHHCHDGNCEQHKKHLAPMNIIGDAVHNIIDGMLIAASYLISIPLGIATTIAVIFHEIPQEIGDFGVLLYSGMSANKALLINFMASVTAIAGAVITLIIGQSFNGFVEILIPIAAGGFIYIAGSDLIPELHHETDVSKSIKQLLLLTAGISLMYLLTFIEQSH
jgi:zinc and cadmium transporter